MEGRDMHDDLLCAKFKRKKLLNNGASVVYIV